MFHITETHCHLDFPDYDEDRDEVIARALDAGVGLMINIGTGLQTSSNGLELSRNHSCVRATAGLHPTSVDHNYLRELEEIEPLVRSGKIVAIGECGLDYHRPPPGPVGEDAAAFLASWKQRQKDVFIRQLDWAVELRMNVVVHQRDSWDDTMEVLQPYAGRLRAVLHCFGGTPEQARQLIEQGHLVSFTGLVTFKNAAIVRETAATVPSGGFMLETDCPYLAPVPHRGTRCEPAHVMLVAETVAALRQTSIKALARETNHVVEEFFRL